MTKVITPKPISGFKEYLPEEELIQQTVIDIVKDEYSSAGFMPLETASVERNEILEAKGGIDSKEIYTIGKLGEDKNKEFSLRFDQTVPFARYVAQNYGQLIYPFKRYQIQKVFRGERPAEGRFREFYQADIDVIGDNTLSRSYDAEILSVISRIFTRLNIGGFKIRVNNRKLQLGLFQEYGIENQGDILKALDKLDKLSRENVKEILLKTISEENSERLLDFALIGMDNFDKVKSFSTNELYQEGIQELEELLEEADLLGVKKENISVDTKIARGLDYYTGIIYETDLTSDLSLGSVCSGGRYDDLASTYTKQKLPGVGISIGISRLVYSILKNKLMELPSQNNADYLIFTSNDKLKMLKVAKYLRDKGESCELSFLSNFKKEMKFAQKKGYTKIVISNPNDDKSFIIRDLTIQDRENSDSSFLL